MDSASPFLSLLIWALLTAAVFASRESNRLIRGLVCTVSLSLFLVFFALGTISTQESVEAWLAIATLTAIASLGPANQKTSLAAFAFSGFVLFLANPTPIAWLGLIHQIALLDLASCSAGTVAVTLLGNGIPLKWNDRCAGILRGPLANLPCPILLRSSLMLFTLIVTWILALLTSERQFERVGILGVWTAVSEVVAAIVAWQIIRGGTRPKLPVVAETATSTGFDRQNPRRDSVQSIEKSALMDSSEDEPTEFVQDSEAFEPKWSYKIAFIVAGISSTMALLLVPLILSVASELDW